ncbi:hypothetical protein ACFQZV_12510 [Microbacterium koreense]|uniref:GGDEF domain-containing protein n=1 Tax=Microbacterium koreense TaxID=323761 RepID=A0ABW2ZUZ5_9MICO
MSVRAILSGLAFAFTAYIAVRVVLIIGEPAPHPAFMFVGFAFYLVVTWICIGWRPSSARRASMGIADPALHITTANRLPVWAAALALAAAVLVPLTTTYAVGEDMTTAPYATWYLGGLGALMVIVLVRRRAWMAWAGIAVLTIESMVLMGPASALALGLVGSIVWVIVAHLVRFSLDRAARDTSQLAQLQRAASAWQSSQLVRQRERRVQIQRALAIAGPVLSRVVVTGGVLSDADRLEARVAEGRLRDELRGPRLLDDDVRAELERARRRGAAVTVLDEGGLEGVDEATLARIRRELAETLRNASSDRIYIRTSPHETIAVTVVGRSVSDEGLSDEDAVDLWREIQHV